MPTERVIRDSDVVTTAMEEGIYAGSKNPYDEIIFPIKVKSHYRDF